MVIVGLTVVLVTSGLQPESARVNHPLSTDQCAACDVPPALASSFLSRCHGGSCGSMPRFRLSFAAILPLTTATHANSLQLDLVDYADDYTRNVLGNLQEHTCVVLPQEAIGSAGLAIDALCSSGLRCVCVALV